MKLREIQPFLSCGEPGCAHDHDDGPMYLHAACHPDDPPWAFIYEGQVVIECSVCRHGVVALDVVP